MNKLQQAVLATLRDAFREADFDLDGSTSVEPLVDGLLLTRMSTDQDGYPLQVIERVQVKVVAPPSLVEEEQDVCGCGDGMCQTCHPELNPPQHEGWWDRGLHTH